MPKDYFEVVVEDEEVLSEGEKHAKVIEFVYQVNMTKSDPEDPDQEELKILKHYLKVTRKSCDPGEYTQWLQDGK